MSLSNLRRAPAQGPHQSSTLMGPKAGAQVPRRFRWAPACAGAPSRSKREREDGFTLVELMVVIVIIGLLATIVLVSVRPAIDRASVTKARADISQIEQAVEMYYLDNRRYPTSEEGIEALVAGQYLRRSRNDPWNNPYRYSAPGRGGQPFTVASLGADGREGGTGENEDIAN